MARQESGCHGHCHCSPGPTFVQSLRRSFARASPPSPCPSFASPTHARGLSSRPADALKFKEEFEAGQKAMAALKGAAPETAAASEAAPASTDGDKPTAEAPTEAKAEA